MQITFEVFNHLIKPYQAEFDTLIESGTVKIENNLITFGDSKDPYAEDSRTWEELLYRVIDYSVTTIVRGKYIDKMNKMQDVIQNLRGKLAEQD